MLLFELKIALLHFLKFVSPKFISGSIVPF